MQNMKDYFLPPMLGVLLASLTAALLSLALYCISWLLAKRTVHDREKRSPFECGFDPVGSARLPFSLRFFLLAVIFLIFDVEIVLLLPAVTSIIRDLSLFTFINIFLFLLILLGGLFHEWNEGSLDWA